MSGYIDRYGHGGIDRLNAAERKWKRFAHRRLRGCAGGTARPATGDATRTGAGCDDAAEQSGKVARRLAPGRQRPRRRDQEGDPERVLPHPAGDDRRSTARPQAELGRS
eukprot:TRINITY_DN1658_c0_g1_i1.p8 TRINITY_DN1658_c0_g1~~TRINITY_DN1658_c0_g1_i1.p8  ORF type:complete len:109 (+),score=1.45 TRINITY_DN1658_c0_g1_i1:592-918(+)